LLGHFPSGMFDEERSAERMKLSDYIIDHSAFEWLELVERWKWILPARFTPWMMNRFGDLFLCTDDGKVHWLRLDNGTLKCVAESKDNFCDKLDAPGAANDWLMLPLVDRLVAAGKILRDRQCYGFIQIPILGGDYTVANVEVRDIAAQYDFIGQAFQQLRDLPDGTPVELVIGKKKEGQQAS
jgi:hypothetical protein